MSDIFVGKKQAIGRERKESAQSKAKKVTAAKAKGVKKKPQNPKGKRAPMGTAVSLEVSAFEDYIYCFVLYIYIFLFYCFTGRFEGVWKSWYVQM